MTLDDIRRDAMIRMGYQGYDYEDEVEAFEPALTNAINVAYAEVFALYDPDGELVELTDPTDEPDFTPKAYHQILSLYAAYSIMMSDRGEKQNRAAALYAEYERMKKGIRKRGITGSPKLTNKY